MYFYLPSSVQILLDLSDIRTRKNVIFVLTNNLFCCTLKQRGFWRGAQGAAGRNSRGISADSYQPASLVLSFADSCRLEIALDLSEGTALVVK